MTMKKLFLAILTAALLLISPSHASTSYSTWNEVVDDMEEVIKSANQTYQQGNLTKARDEVNHAYFGFYEKIGFERTVMAHISGNRAAAHQLPRFFVGFVVPHPPIFKRGVFCVKNRGKFCAGFKIHNIKADKCRLCHIRIE